MKTTLLPLLALFVSTALGQYPNPYRIEEGWAKLPNGRQMGALGGLKMDPDGKHLWAIVRCYQDGPGRFGNECLDWNLKFNMVGEVVASFGSGLIIWPHGMDVDAGGNVWVADSLAPESHARGDSRPAGARVQPRRQGC